MTQHVTTDLRHVIDDVWWDSSRPELLNDFNGSAHGGLTHRNHQNVTGAHRRLTDRHTDSVMKPFRPMTDTRDWSLDHTGVKLTGSSIFATAEQILSRAMLAPTAEGTGLDTVGPWNSMIWQSQNHCSIKRFKRWSVLYSCDLCWRYQMIVASARCQDVRDGPFPFPDERHKLENDATVMLDLIDQTEIHHHLHDTRHTHSDEEENWFTLIYTRLKSRHTCSLTASFLRRLMTSSRSFRPCLAIWATAELFCLVSELMRGSSSCKPPFCSMNLYSVCNWDEHQHWSCETSAVSFEFNTLLVFIIKSVAIMG